jgi:regulator of sigma E protease
MITILSTIFVLGVLIFVHELGHFLVAKKAGIRVDKFSLGFPPSIFSRKFGETQYSIGAIPLGGFVKMAGENPDEEATGAPDEFMSKSLAARAAVITAGPFTNFLVAWIILWGLFLLQGEAVTDPDHAVIGIVVEGSPAEQAGLMTGDIVKSINGTPVAGFSEMAVLISKEVEKPITIVWERKDRKMSATVTTMAEEAYNEQGEKTYQGRIGVGWYVEYHSLGFLGAAHKSFIVVVDFVDRIARFIWDLVSLKVSVKMIGGPVFIAKMAGQTAQLGFSALLFFMSFLSVNLAILNILPIPMLDGGHLVFLLVEKIKGSPMTVNQRMIAQQVGLAFLLLLIVFVTYNDIARFISG